MQKLSEEVPDRMAKKATSARDLAFLAFRFLRRMAG
jgi:hypothetical protein